jgi:hypothetical protein
VSAADGTSAPGTSGVAGLLLGLALLARRREKLNDHIAKLPAPTAEQLRVLLREVARMAGDSGRPSTQRLPEIDLLAFLPWNEVRDVLLNAIAPTEPSDVQRTALRILGSFNELAVSNQLLRKWKQLTPPLREEAVTVLLSRPIWHEPLMTVSGRHMINDVIQLCGGSNVFAGQFISNTTGGNEGGNPTGTPGQPTTLTLTNLPPHDSIDLNFLLAIIDSWDGSNPDAAFCKSSSICAYTSAMLALLVLSLNFFSGINKGTSTKFTTSRK